MVLRPRICKSCTRHFIPLLGDDENSRNIIFISDNIKGVVDDGNDYSIITFTAVAFNVAMIFGLRTRNKSCK